MSSTAIHHLLSSSCSDTLPSTLVPGIHVNTMCRTQRFLVVVCYCCRNLNVIMMMERDEMVGRSFVSVFMLGAMKVSPSPPPPPQSMSYTYRFLLRCCMHCWWVVGLVVVGDAMDRQGDKHLFFHISCCSPLEILHTDGFNGYIRSSYWLAGYAACPAAPPDDGDDMHEARI